MSADAEYMRKYRQRRRAHAVILLGGQCAKCGSEEDLEIDHRDPAKKLFPLAGFSRAWASILAELEECQLLCQPCHRAKTGAENAGRFTKGCGSVAQAKRGCDCEPCRIAIREARRRWNLNYRGRI